MQARAKRDLYDTSMMIKGDFEGRRWTLRDLDDKHSMLECHRELAGLEGKYRELTISQKARGYFLGCRGKSREKAESL